jgi:hypothetical protein
MRRKVSSGRGGPVAGKKRTHRRRRGIGASKLNIEDMAMTAGGLIAGSVAARELNTVIVKQFPSFSALVSGLVQMGLGFIIPMFVKNNKFVRDMGYGMIANGGMVTIVSTGLISGQKRLSYRVNGPLNLDAVNGTSALRVVSGINTRPRLTTTRPAPNMRPNPKHIY